ERRLRWLCHRVSGPDGRRPGRIASMTTRHDAYRSLAGHYDLHGWDWYARSCGPRVIELLRERALPAGASILDAGCGTGSLALMLAASGYRVTGVDYSSEMIARARA